MLEYVSREWELYDFRSDPQETRNLYDDADQADLVRHLKQMLTLLRVKVVDDGSHFPKCEEVVQEFWDYDSSARVKAIELSHAYRERREAELEEGQRGQRTWLGKRESQGTGRVSGK